MSTTLAGHPLIQRATKRMLPVVLAGAQRVRENPGREAEVRTENAASAPGGFWYHRGVFQRAMGLVQTIGSARTALRLMGLAPSTVGLRRAGMGRDQWADYHFGVFTVAVASVPDVGTVLAGTVFKLGLPPRLYTQDLVTSHESIKGTPIVPALKALRAAAKDTIERRHGHVHRGELVDVSELAAE